MYLCLYLYKYLQTASTSVLAKATPIEKNYSNNFFWVENPKNDFFLGFMHKKLIWSHFRVHNWILLEVFKKNDVSYVHYIMRVLFYSNLIRFVLWWIKKKFTLLKKSWLNERSVERVVESERQLKFTVNIVAVNACE